MFGDPFIQSILWETNYFEISANLEELERKLACIVQMQYVPNMNNWKRLCIELIKFIEYKIDMKI